MSPEIKNQRCDPTPATPGKAGVAALAAAAILAVPVAPAPQMAPRPPSAFSLDGAVTVAPASLQDDAHRLGFPVVTPDAVLETSGLCWKQEYENRPLVLLGSIESNRALLPVYAAFLDATDARYPGRGGFVVRRLTLPRRLLILGGSDEKGVRQAVSAYLRDAAEQPAVIRLGRQVSLPSTLQSTPLLNAWLFLLRGERRFAEEALKQIESKSGGADGHFTEADYYVEQTARAYRILAAHGVISPERLAALDNAWLRTLLADQNQYWRARDGSRIGSRHQTMGTHAFHFIVRMLLNDGAPNAEARALLEGWDRECRAYFDNALTTFHDDLEGIPSYHSVQPMLHWALEAGRLDYLSDQLPRAVRRALAVTDSLGAYAGAGTYEEARPGTVRSSIMLGYPLAALAYLTRDPEWTWLSRHFAPTTGTWGYYSVWGAHGFAMTASDERQPTDELGLQVTPLGDYRLRRSLHSPAQSERFFEKLTWRSGWNRAAAFMVLQGWQGASADNLPPVDGNAILRFTSRGHIWLFTNTREMGHYPRNAVHLSFGLDREPRPQACELLHREERDGVLMTATRLAAYNGADWTRYVWWIRGSWIAVIDRLQFRKAGRCTAVCTWRSPQPARLDGQRWTALAGDSRFDLLAMDDDVHLAAEDGEVDGAAAPYFLRQRRVIDARPGGEAWFRNVFAVDEPLQARAEGRSGVHIVGVGVASVDGEQMSWRTSKEQPTSSSPATSQAESHAPTAATGPFVLPLQPIAGTRLIADPPPARGEAGVLVDELASPYAGVAWNEGTRPMVSVEVPGRQRIAAIELALPMLASRNRLPERLPPPVDIDIDGRTIRFTAEFDLLPLHKGTVFPFARYIARGLDMETDRLRIRLPLTRLRRIRLYSARPKPVRVTHFQACDLGGDGQLDLVAADDSGQFVVFDPLGGVRWRHRFAGAVTALLAADDLFIATREGKLYGFTADGKQKWTTSFLGAPGLEGDCPTPYSVARAGDEILVGNYARATFLDGRGSIVSTCFAYGAFETGWLPNVVDLTGDGRHDHLLYNVWGTASVIDGASHKTVRYISIPRGAKRLFARASAETGATRDIWVVSENGVARIDPTAGKGRWRHDFGPITSAVLFAGGVAVAKADGFIVRLNAQGAAVAQTWLPARPHALTTVGNHLCLIAGDEVWTLDRDLHPLRRAHVSAAALASHAPTLWVLTATGRVIRHAPTANDSPRNTAR